VRLDLELESLLHGYVISREAFPDHCHDSRSDEVATFFIPLAAPADPDTEWTLRFFFIVAPDQELII
jgi:hypothetical protein